MNTDFSQVAQSALSLPQSDRAKLASELLRSLDAQVDEDPQAIADQWADVILARSDALHGGEVQFIAGDEVVAEMRAAIATSKSATEK